VLFLQRLLLLGGIVGSVWGAHSSVRVEPLSPSPHGLIKVFLDFILCPSFFLSMRGGMGSAVLPSVGEYRHSQGATSG